ncbi:MAG: peptidylprolyl isomerase [Desulfuromonadaceae bacterium]|nr:peptidylprolyl isomerase [Desulfuromonadaceae bacterium]
MKNFIYPLVALLLLTLVQTSHATNPEGVRVAITTNVGSFEINLNVEEAPVSTRNFLEYVDSGFYAGTVFHRVIKGFMIQGGGFTESMLQKPTQAAITNEAHNGLRNRRGTIAMARTNQINSATSQFFINVEDNGFLDHRNVSASGYGYAVFGKVVKGMDVVDEIAAMATAVKKNMSDVPVKSIVIHSIERI